MADDIPHRRQTESTTWHQLRGIRGAIAWIKHVSEVLRRDSEALIGHPECSYGPLTSYGYHDRSIGRTVFQRILEQV